MAKELPYFRFTVAEWLNDDISLESYHLQGVFISVCAFYWFQDCSIALAKLKKRFSNAQAEIEELLKLGIIKKVDEKHISIKFLDEQFDLLSEKREKRVEAGRKGGLAKSKQSSSNAKAMLKQSSSYKDKDKDKDKDKSAFAFDAFWDLYDKKKDRKKCEKKWSAISVSEKEKIMEFIPVYKKSQSDEQYRKNPYTFLNSEIWNDEWDSYKKNGTDETRKGVYYI